MPSFLSFSKKLNLVFAVLLFSLTCFGQTSGTNLDDYEKVKPLLRVRIYSDASVAQKGGVDGLMSRVDLKGTTTLLMIDQGEGFAPLFKADFEKWNKPAEDVFKAAMANASGEKVEKVIKNFEVDGNQIEFIFLTNEDHAASYALGLADNSPELLGEWGSVMVIPNKGMAVLCKISKDKPLDFVKFIQSIKPISDKYFAEHQVPVSKEFFWYYKGKFTLMSVVTADDGSINVIAPLGLGELMSVKQ